MTPHTNPDGLPPDTPGPAILIAVLLALAVAVVLIVALLVVVAT